MDFLSVMLGFGFKAENFGFNLETEDQTLALKPKALA